MLAGYYLYIWVWKAKHTQKRIRLTSKLERVPSKYGLYGERQGEAHASVPSLYMGVESEACAILGIRLTSKLECVPSKYGLYGERESGEWIAKYMQYWGLD